MQSLAHFTPFFGEHLMQRGDLAMWPNQATVGYEELAIQQGGPKLGWCLLQRGNPPWEAANEARQRDVYTSLVPWDLLFLGGIL